MNKSRPKKVSFRLSLEEFSQLRERIKTSELSSQEFLRRSVLEIPIIPKSDFQEILIELRHEGTNLNQIARACNKGEIDGSAIQSQMNNLEVLWQSLKQLVQKPQKQNL